MIAPIRSNISAQTDPEYRFVVMLFDGPCDGQDIRAPNAELTQGVIVRSNHMYVRSGATSTGALPRQPCRCSGGWKRPRSFCHHS